MECPKTKRAAQSNKHIIPLASGRYALKSTHVCVLARLSPTSNETAHTRSKSMHDPAQSMFSCSPDALADVLQTAHDLQHGAPPPPAPPPPALGASPGAITKRCSLPLTHSPRPSFIVVVVVLWRRRFSLSSSSSSSPSSPSSSSSSSSSSPVVVMVVCRRGRHRRRLSSSVVLIVVAVVVVVVGVATESHHTAHSISQPMRRWYAADALPTTNVTHQ
jgi:hypothetical protein